MTCKQLRRTIRILDPFRCGARAVKAVADHLRTCRPCERYVKSFMTHAEPNEFEQAMAEVVAEDVRNLESGGVADGTA